MLILNLLIFFASLVLLVISSTFGVKSLVKLARALKISEFVMAFIISAFATTLPEFFVSINASLIKSGDIVLGNIVGSNLADIALIGGLVIIFARTISTKNQKMRKDAMWAFFLGSLPLILFFIGKGLSRIDGILLILSSFIYFYFVFKIKKYFRKAIESRAKPREIFINTLILIASFTLVYFSSQWVVKYAKFLAEDLKISALLISLFLIAVGTSLPELALGLQAIRLNRSEIALGDLLGSIIANSTVILGIASIINPIVITEATTIFIGGMFFVISAYLFVIFMHVSNKLTLPEGIALVLLYIFFIILEFFAKIAP